jgi:excisionase family DNA binding protein
MNDAILEEFMTGIADAVAERVLKRLCDDGLARAPAGPWRLITVDEATAILRRSRRWIHDATKNRGLPYVKLDGGKVMFDPEQVRDWALSRTVPAQPDLCTPRARAPQPRSENGIRALPGTRKQRAT